MKQTNLKTVLHRSRLIISIAAMAMNVPSHAQVISTAAGTGSMGYAGDGAQATAAQLFYPTGTAEDASGNLYIADQNNNVVRKVTTTGIISTVAGNGSAGSSGDGGPATSAQMVFPFAVAVDASGNMFIADQLNNRIRKVNSSGTISTLAGNGTPGFSGDGGAATAAKVSQPSGMVVDASGSLYFADQGNSRIRKITAAGIISTVAGNGSSAYGGDGGQATAAELQNPTSLVFDAAGNMYIADDGNYVIRKVNTAGIISTIAGTSTPGSSGDGGPATAAKVSACYGIAVDANNNVYISQPNLNTIRKISNTGTITTIAGTGTAGFSGDGGPASAAALQTTQGLMIDHTGELYLADAGNNKVRKFKVGPTLNAPAIEHMTSNVSFFPVPSEGLFIVTGQLDNTDIQQATLHVCDMTGNTVFTRQVTTSGGKIEALVDLRDLPVGIYIAKISTPRAIATCKIIIER